MLSVAQLLSVLLPECFIESSKVETITTVIADAGLSLSGPLNSQCDRPNQHNETECPAKIVNTLKQLLPPPSE